MQKQSDRWNAFLYFRYGNTILPKLLCRNITTSLPQYQNVWWRTGNSYISWFHVSSLVRPGLNSSSVDASANYRIFKADIKSSKYLVAILVLIASKLPLEYKKATVAFRSSFSKCMNLFVVCNKNIENYNQ